MGEGINLVLLITIPATVGIIVLAQPIVEVAFERGEFTAADTIMTKQALIFYSLGLVAMGMRLLITRVYYSLHNTRTPMINGALSVGFNISLNLILIRYMAHAGLAFATSISVTVATLILFFGLMYRFVSPTITPLPHTWRRVDVRSSTCCILFISFSPFRPGL